MDRSTNTGEPMTRGQLQDQLAKRAFEDKNFRRSLLDDPKATIEDAFETKLPEHVQVKVIMDSEDECYVVVPHSITEDGELRDGALDEVTGGLLTLSTHANHRPQ